MVVYLILAHTRFPQLRRLVHRLRDAQSAFVIHIDARSTLGEHQALLDELAADRDVRMAPRNCSPWGGFGLVEATLAGLAVALDAYPETEHICVLSGQDYPIKPPSRFHHFLENHPGRSFIEYHPLPRAGWADGGLWRTADYHFHALGRRLRIPVSAMGFPRTPPLGLAPFQGGQCWTMSRDCAEYVCRLVEEQPALIRFFRRTAHADESFFQTIVMGSPFAARTLNDDLRFEAWEEDAPHPRILVSADLGALRESPCFFAKKFDTHVDAHVLDEIDRNLIGSPVG